MRLGCPTQFVGYRLDIQQYIKYYKYAKNHDLPETA
jgi:hypothetical protein